MLQRVATLLKDNRHYRRQVIQVQLAPAATAGTPADRERQQLALPEPAASGQQQMAQEAQSGTAGAVVPDATAVADDSPDVDSPAATAAAAVELSQLRESLADAEQQLALLSDENEKLMELSNSLRAENEQLTALQVSVCQSISIHAAAA